MEAVFNYDIPQDDEYYVHRIGRTGRAGREGRAFSLAVGSEVYKLRDIQRFCKTKIVPQPIPSLDDVTAIKAEKILDDVQQHIGDDSNLERMTDIIEKRLLAEDYTSLELAAAFLKMAMGDDYEDIADEEDRSVTLTISTDEAEEMTAEETDADAREAMTRSTWTERTPEAA